jgi:hypothetical protein
MVTRQRGWYNHILNDEYEYIHKFIDERCGTTFMKDTPRRQSYWMIWVSRDLHVNMWIAHWVRGLSSRWQQNPVRRTQKISVETLSCFGLMIMFLAKMPCFFSMFVRHVWVARLFQTCGAVQHAWGIMTRMIWLPLVRRCWARQTRHSDSTLRANSFIACEALKGAGAICRCPRLAKLPS